MQHAVVGKCSFAVPGRGVKGWVREHVDESPAGRKVHYSHHIPVRVVRTDHHLGNGRAKHSPAANRLESLFCHSGISRKGIPSGHIRCVGSKFRVVRLILSLSVEPEQVERGYGRLQRQRHQSCELSLSGGKDCVCHCRLASGLLGDGVERACDIIDHLRWFGNACRSSDRANVRYRNKDLPILFTNIGFER